MAIQTELQFAAEEAVLPTMMPAIPALKAERPSEYATRLGHIYAESTDSQHKKSFGQFFTPQIIADYLATLSGFSGAAVRLLDPGCGTGVLGCALVEHIVAHNPAIKSVSLAAYEMDSAVYPYAQQVQRYLKQWLEERGIGGEMVLRNTDFILSNEQVWDMPLGEAALYDVVVSNPPYFKLGKDDPRNNLARSQQQDQPNMYSLFIVLATLLTKSGGEVVFIVPRSFCSGPYFEKFRAFLYAHLSFQVFHLFNSRSKAFKKDAVLQENMIFKATRLQDSLPQPDATVAVVSSEAGEDLHAAHRILCRLDELVDLGSREKVLFLPTDERERNLIASFKNWRHRLLDFGIQVSTGPVVAFRTTAYLRDQANEFTVPLLWIDNVKRAQIEWPTKRARQQHLLLEGGKKAGLLPNCNYVLLRRFSAKDDKHRLVAAPYYASRWPGSHVGLENKLNYLYMLNGELTEVQTTGLAALLNSSLYDAFFRIFNGNTQVSATEARALPVPSLDVIETIGRRVLLEGAAVVDKIVEDTLANV